MSLNAKAHKGGSDIPVLDVDTYPARLVQAIDVGTHEQFDYQTKKSQGFKPRVILTFELPTELYEFDGEEKPRWISREWTLSYNKKSTMFKIIQALDPKDEANGVISEMLGAPCSLTIGHSKTGKAKIGSIGAVTKGMTVDELFNEPRFFDMDAPDMEQFKAMPEWIRDKIKESREYGEGDGDGGDAAIKVAIELFESGVEDDIPF